MLKSQLKCTILNSPEPVELVGMLKSQQCKQNHDLNALTTPEPVELVSSTTKIFNSPEPVELVGMLKSQLKCTIS
jgi:hypothetical protein